MTPPESVTIPETLAEFAVPIDSVHTFGKNPRRGDVELIMESLKAHGQYKPIVGNRRTGDVLVGNHTLAAARRLGWTEIAVSWVDVDEDKATEIVLMDNRSSDLAGYDNRALLELLESLPSIERGRSGFTNADYAALSALVDEPVRLTDPDDAPPVREGPHTCKAGQVWQLGPHRLAVGDCTSGPVIDQLLAGDDPVDLLLTDPPYGVSYVGADGMTVANDDLRDTDLYRLLVDAFSQSRTRLRPGGPFYIFAPSNAQQSAFRTAIADANLQLRHELVWVKSSLVMGRSDYHPRHESVLAGDVPDAEEDVLEHEAVFYGWQEGARHTWNGGRKQSTVLEYPKPRSSKEHPTMKPVEMLEQLVRNSSDAGALVLDLFAGSGSTLIAAHGTGRVARVVELWPRYADVICRRWQDHTGIVPMLAGQEVDFSG